MFCELRNIKALKGVMSNGVGLIPAADKLFLVEIFDRDLLRSHLSTDERCWERRPKAYLK